MAPRVAHRQFPLCRAEGGQPLQLGISRMAPLLSAARVDAEPAPIAVAGEASPRRRNKVSAIATLVVLIGGLLALDYVAVRWGFDSRPLDLGRSTAERW